MAANQAPRGIVPVAALFCVAASAAATVTGALLYIAAVSVTLLITTLVAALLRALPRRMNGLIALLLAAALAGALRTLLAARAPAWLEAMGPALLFEAILLLCAPVALTLAAAEKAPFSRTVLPAAALLVTGAVRELLAAGTLMGVRLLPAGVSPDFGLGALGVITGGLVMALFCLRERDVFRYSIREGCAAGGCTVMLAAAAGLLMQAAVRLAPLPERVWPLLTVLLVGLLAALGARLMPEGMWREPFGDQPLWISAVIAVLTVLSREGVWWQGAVWQLAAAAVLGGALCLVAALMERVNNIHLPAPFRLAPAVVVAAGAALLAFAVL